MKYPFGVSSATPSNKVLKNGYTLYDWVKRQKCFPAFWGRDLSGENSITAEEMEFLKDKNCKILLLFRNLTEAKVSRSDGTFDAMIAIAGAKTLGIPENEGIAIFAEIKPEWSVNHNWMISFAKTIRKNGFIPGFIGNTDSSKNFNFDRQCSHYVQATGEDNQFDAIFGATEPKFEGTPKEWAPFCPSALEPEDMKLWSCGKTTFGEVQVEDIYLNDKNILENML